MPRRVFEDPDIDPALIAEAQAVVDEASRSLDQWIDKNFARIEADIKSDLDSMTKDAAQQIKTAQEKDARINEQLINSFKRLQSAAQELSPLDADQKTVIDKITQLTEEVSSELAARTERWHGLGGNVVEVAKSAITKAIGIS
ncbi:hypothetical protein KFE80_05355 [bacterium SCSIO 12696]|nr:hypothetical protein KFE80_05355 [bacterium SCSIO 12696]